MVSENVKGIAILALNLASRLMGLLRTLFISAIYGSGSNADVLNYSFSFPNQTRKGLQEGLGNLSLLRSLSRDRRIEEEVVSKLLSLHAFFLLILLPLSYPLGLVLMHLSDYGQDARLLGASFMPLYVVFIIFYSLAQSLSAVLQDAGYYVRGQALPLVFSFLVLSLLFFFGKHSIYVFPLSMAFSSLVYLLVVLISLSRAGVRVKFSKHFDWAFLQSYMKGTYIVFLAIALNMTYYICSTRMKGGATYFSNAHLMILLPYGILISLFAGYHYPKIALEENRWKRLVRIDRALKLLLMLVLPVAILFLTFTKEISIVVFLHGRYTMNDAIHTSLLMNIMIPGMVFMMLFNFLQRLTFLEKKEGMSYLVYLLTILLSLCTMFLKGDSSLLPAYLFTLTNLAGALILLSTSRLVSFKRFIIHILKALLVCLPEILFFIYYRGNGYNLFRMTSSRLIVVLAASFIGISLSVVSFIIYYLVGRTD